MGSLTQANPANTTENMDITGGKKLKDLFRGDTVLHDNFLFKLHHQANFAVILFGVAFIFGMNYLNGNAIECKGKDVGDFEKQYCWLHGAGHISEELHPTDFKCKADQNQLTTEFKKDDRHTHYYLWVPFILVLCLAVTKAPRVFWKQVCERGMISGAVGGTDGQPADKIAERFGKLRRGAKRFHLSFFLCELLNIASVIICFTMLDTLLGGNFLDYGSKFAQYSGSADTETETVNPLCNVFPTVVSCNVRTGGATGNPDLTNILCLLSNNLFNQYYFLILWYWWVSLLTVSAVGLVYRLAEIISQDVSKWVFVCKMEPHGQDRAAARLVELRSADYFLLGRICQNLKGSQIGDVLLELRKQSNNAELNTEKHAILNMEGNTKEPKLPQVVLTE